MRLLHIVIGITTDLNGYSYKSQSWISDYYGGMDALFAGVTCSNQVAGNIPVGYMGCQAQLYDSNNNLIAYTNWSYNKIAENSMGIIRWGDSYNSGYYYSRGKTAAYNGNGYNYYWAYISPNLYWGG